ncbi:hypothetical protein, partial [Halococcus thailandensis]|uniref:hypothetical protein n=1 Tax=Halococcus thailandensis TaxID=335952 RepID=UPI0019D3C550
MVSKITPQILARGAAGLAGITGSAGFLYLMGAFGPVSCWTSESVSSSGEVTTSQGCEAGIDYLFGSTGGNASVLFFWAVVLLGLVILGGAAIWTGKRRITWLTVVAGVVISILGVWSIGWYYVLPTLFLLIAGTCLAQAISVVSPRARTSSAVGRCNRRTSSSSRDGLRIGDHP